jgi:hypothetical protein
VSHGALVALLSFELKKGTRAVKFVQDRVRPMFESVVTELERMRARGDIRPNIDTKHFAISAVAAVAYPIEQKRLMSAVWPKGSTLEDGRQAAVARMLCDALLP